MHKNKIKNIIDLRDHAIATVEKLASGQIDKEEAASTAKLCETVLGSVKIEIEYAKLNNRIPRIDFLGELKGAVIQDASLTQPPRRLTHKD